MNRKNLQVACILCQLALWAAVASADDWPQWMGPQRDNVWRETGIVDRFPADGLKVRWRAKVAGGYSGPAVADGVVIVTDYVTSDDVKVANFERKQFTGIERVLCLDESTGKEKWKHGYPVEYTISYPAGPRCTPIIHEGMVYTLGAEGHLFCFRQDTGEVVWSKDFKKDYGAKAPLWGYAAHPLLDGDRLVCIVGGEGTHAVAFNKDTGEQVWSVLNAKEQGYAPPTIITAAGRRQLILLRPDGVSGVNPETGEEYWTAPYEATNGSIIMSPLQYQDYLYVGGYSNKHLLLKLRSEAPGYDVVWQDLKTSKKRGISPVNVQPMLVGGVIYGMGQGGDFYAVDMLSGDRIWETAWPLGKRPQQTGTAFIVRNEDRYFLFTELGELVIASLGTDKEAPYAELDRTKLLEPTNVAFGRPVVWSAPAFANKCIYVRNDDECICVDLSK